MAVCVLFVCRLLMCVCVHVSNVGVSFSLRVHVSMHACVCVCMRACMRVCLLVHVRVFCVVRVFGGICMTESYL